MHLVHIFKLKTQPDELEIFVQVVQMDDVFWV